MGDCCDSHVGPLDVRDHSSSSVISTIRLTEMLCLIVFLPDSHLIVSESS